MDNRKQVEMQCRVVAHLAKNLAEVYGQMAEMFAAGHCESIVDQVGDRTAAFMEKLGDMLNATDAVSEEDEWTAPIFEQAHKLWPHRSDEP